MNGGRKEMMRGEQRQSFTWFLLFFFFFPIFVVSERWTMVGKREWVNNGVFGCVFLVDFCVSPIWWNDGGR